MLLVAQFVCGVRYIFSILKSTYLFIHLLSFSRLFFVHWSQYIISRLYVWLTGSLAAKKMKRKKLKKKLKENSSFLFNAHLHVVATIFIPKSKWEPRDNSNIGTPMRSLNCGFNRFRRRMRTQAIKIDDILIHGK